LDASAVNRKRGRDVIFPVLMGSGALSPRGKEGWKSMQNHEKGWPPGPAPVVKNGEGHRRRVARMAQGHRMREPGATKNGRQRETFLQGGGKTQIPSWEVKGDERRPALYKHKRTGRKNVYLGRRYRGLFKKKAAR